MTMTNQLGFEAHLALAHDAAIIKVTEALKSEGFGVLTRIDLDQAFRDKIGAEFRAYTILGACNPTLAHSALFSKAELGLMLPCNVTVEAAPGGSLVRIVNPAVMMQMGDWASDDVLREVATEAAGRLQRVCDSLNG